MKQKNSTIHRQLLITIFFILAGSCLFAVQANDKTEADIKELIKRVKNSAKGDPVWDLGMAMSDLGKEAASPLLNYLKKQKNPNVILAISYALLRLGEQKEACLTLEKLITTSNIDLNKRLDAASALGIEGGEYASARIRNMLDNKNLPELIQVELAKALWRLTHGNSASEKLRQLLKANSIRARNEAAVALATMVPLNETVSLLKDLVFKPGRTGEEARKALLYKAKGAMFESSFVEIAPLLRQLSEQPSLNLGSAKLLLEISSWSEVDKYRTRKGLATRLIQEIADKIKDDYAISESGDAEARRREQERLTTTSLATNAAKALAQSVGPFCAYLDDADITEMSEQIGGEYGGIGAWVGIRNTRFTILLPMYNEPAFKSGLRAMDWIEKIEEKPIKNLSQKEIIKMLKGPPRTSVKLLVWRRGWNKAHTFTVVRKRISIPSVRSRMLPDKIGYIRIERFGREDITPAELNKSLKKLHSKGMTGLVLDLSNNPGGMLSTAVRISDKFLPGGKLIVYSKGKPGVHDRKDYYSTSRKTEPPYPIVVLINGSSASASEILAGALRDHKRATLVGEKSFGKGSVQQLLWMRATGKRTCLKLTIAKYYLPHGDCIHGIGIKPDIAAPLPDISMASFEARRKLIDSLIISDYVRDTFPKYEKKFRELFNFDHEDATLYPEFEKLFAKIKREKIVIQKNDVRHEIRRALLTYLESERGEDIVVDLQENPPLQRAVNELRKKLTTRNNAVPIYTWYNKKIKLAEKEEQEKKAKSYPPLPKDK